MKCRAGVILAVAGGYYLGRTKRMKFALIMGGLVTGVRGRRPARGSHISTERSPQGAPPDEGGFEDGLAESPRQVPANRVDDVAPSAVAETVTFGLDGRFYRLDLPAENAARLREALAPFVAVARLSSQGGRGRPARSGRDGVQRSQPGSDRNRNAAIREWARQRGHELPKRGRIPAAVLEMYKNDVG